MVVGVVQRPEGSDDIVLLSPRPQSAHLTCLFQDERLWFSYLLQRCCFELVVFIYAGGCFEDLWFWSRNLRVSWLTWPHIFWKWGDMENHQQVKYLSIPNMDQIWQLHYITCQKINSSQSQNGGCFFASNLNFKFTSVEGLQGCPVIWPFGKTCFIENTTERGDKDVSAMLFLLMLLMGVESHFTGGYVSGLKVVILAFYPIVLSCPYVLTK